MKNKKYFSLLFLLISIISFSSNQISKIFPLYKVIMTEDINEIKKSNINFNVYLNIKGMGVIFDNNSDISVMPKRLYKEIERFYKDMYYNFLYFDIKSKDGYIILMLNGESKYLDPINFIFEDIGIKIPVNILFKEIDNQEYNYTFLVKEDEEHIIFGKDLINDLEIEINENKINIKNEDFIVKVIDD